MSSTDLFALPPVESNFYMEHPDVTAMPEQEVAAWRRDHRIDVKDRRAPKPARTFLEAAFPEEITAELEGAGFDAPTAIQGQAWPIALSGLDLVGLANTGSGKTLAFVLPALVHILAQELLQVGDGPIALMLAPTRELAVQIKAECDRFGTSSGVRNTAVYGGVPKGPQLRDLQQGVEVAIATPGRLLDFLDEGRTNLRRVTYLVLDEADRMLDLGFEPQLRQIASLVRPDRQTIMCSATWPREVERLAREWLCEPVMVTVDNAKQLTANSNIAQHFTLCYSDADKQQALQGVLGAVAAEGASRIIIFCASKRGCESVRTDLRRRGYAAESLHGDKSQQERDWVLLQFKQGAVAVLIATDVASRGLDVKDVRAVINFDAPGQAEDYVHRIGRAGRAGATGDAFTLLTPSDAPFAREVASMQRRSGEPVARELLRLADDGGRGGGAGGRAPPAEQRRRW